MSEPSSELQLNILMETGNDNSLEPGEISGGSTPKPENIVKDARGTPSESFRSTYKDGINQNQKFYQSNASQNMYRASFNQHFRNTSRMRGHPHWNRGSFSQHQPRMSYRNQMNREMGNERNIDFNHKEPKQSDYKIRHTKTKPSLDWSMTSDFQMPLSSSGLRKRESDTILSSKPKFYKNSSSPTKKSESLDREPKTRNGINKKCEAELEKSEILEKPEKSASTSKTEKPDNSSSRIRAKKSVSKKRKSNESTDRSKELKLKRRKLNKSKSSSKSKEDLRISSKKKNKKNNKIKKSHDTVEKKSKIDEKYNNNDEDTPNTPEIPEYEESTTPPPKFSSENKVKYTAEKLPHTKENKNKKDSSKSKIDLRLSFADELEDDELEVPSLNEDVDIFPLTKDETICAIDSKKEEKKLKKKEKDLNEKCDDESSPDTDDYQDTWEEDIDLSITKESPSIEKKLLAKNISKQNKLVKSSVESNITPEKKLVNNLKSKNDNNQLMDKKTEINETENSEELIKDIANNRTENVPHLKRKEDSVEETKVNTKIDFQIMENELTANLLNLKHKIQRKSIEMNNNGIENHKLEKLQNRNLSIGVNLAANQNKEVSLYSPDKKSKSSTSSSSTSTTSSSSSTTSSSTSSSYSSEDEQTNLRKSEIRDGLGTPIFVNPSPPANLEESTAIGEGNTPPLTSPIKQALSERGSKDLHTNLTKSEIKDEEPLPGKNPPKQKKLLFGMQDIYEQFIQSVNNAGIDLSVEQKIKNENVIEKKSSCFSAANNIHIEPDVKQSSEMEETLSIKPDPKKVVDIELQEAINKEQKEKITPIPLKPPIKTTKSPFEPSSSDSDSTTDSDTDSDSSSDSLSSSSVSEDEILTQEDKKKLRALEKRLNTLKTWTAADEDEKKCFDGLQKLIQNEINLVKCKYEENEDKCKYEEKETAKTSFKIIETPKIKLLPEPMARIFPKIPAVLQQIPMQLPSDKLLSQKDVPQVIAPQNVLKGFTMPLLQIFSIEKEMSKAELQNDKNKTTEKDVKSPKEKEKENRDSKESSKSKTRSSERNSNRRRSPIQRRSSPQHSKQKKILSPHSASPNRSSKSSKKTHGSRSYKSDRRSRSRTRSLSSSKRFRSNRSERKPSSPALRGKIRSKSPLSPRNFKRRSLSPLKDHRRPITPAHRHSISPPRRRSISPRRRSVSPRRRSVSPRRRSISPRKRSITPRKRSLTPRKRSVSPRKRSVSPRKRSVSPRRRSVSPRKRSVSPRRRSVTPRRRSISPRRRSISPRRRSITPRRRSISPRRRITSPRRYSRSPPFRPPSPPSPSPMQRDVSRSPIHYRNSSPYSRRYESSSRSISPEYNRHKNHRVSSPRWNDEISNHFYPEGYQYITSPRQDGAYQSYNPQFNSYSDYMPTLAESAYSSYELQYPQTSDYSSCSSFDNQGYYYNEYQIPNDQMIQTHQVDQLSQISPNLRDRAVVKEKSTVAVRKGNVLEIVPTVTIPQTDEIKITLEKSHEKNEQKKAFLWREEVNRRHVLSAVLKLNRESDGGSLKSILCKTSEETKTKERKKVLFADGIEPGSGPTDEKGVYLKSGKKKRKKKNTVIKHISQDDKENLLEIVDPELENAEPPPPPPGSPPPHLPQPTLIRPPSPDLFLYFHYDPVVNSMYVSQLENAAPPRLLQRPVNQKNISHIDKNTGSSSIPQMVRKHEKLITSSEKVSADKGFSMPPNMIGGFQHSPRFLTSPANSPSLHQRIAQFPVVPSFFNAPPPNQYQTNNIVLTRAPNYTNVGIQSSTMTPILKSDSTPAFSSDSVSSSSGSFFPLPGAVQKILRNELKLCSPIGSPTSSSSSSPKIGASPTLISSPNLISSKVNSSNLTIIEPTIESVEEKITEENSSERTESISQNSVLENRELSNLLITQEEISKL